MKKNVSLFFVFIILIFLSCTKKQEEKLFCEKSSTNYEDTWFSDSFSAESHLLSGTGNLPKTFIFKTQKISGICTFQHVVVFMQVKINESFKDQIISVRGEAQWGIFGAVEVNLQYNSTNLSYEGSVDFGLKQAFGDGPGEIDQVVFIIEVASQGNFEQDMAFIHQLLEYVDISIDYYKPF